MKMGQKYHVKLSETDREQLHKIQVAAQTPVSIRNRCGVLLLADENAGARIKQSEIAMRCGVSSVTVSDLVKRYDTLGLENCLRRRHHEKPPRASILSGEKEARIIALACTEAPEGYSKWSVRLLKNKVIELKIMDTVSRETIRRVLKKRNLSLT